MHPLLQKRLKNILMAKVCDEVKARHEYQWETAVILRIPASKVGLLKKNNYRHNFSITALLGFLLHLGVPITLTIDGTTIKLS